MQKLIKDEVDNVKYKLRLHENVGIATKYFVLKVLNRLEESMSLNYGDYNALFQFKLTFIKPDFTTTPFNEACTCSNPQLAILVLLPVILWVSILTTVQGI